MLDKKPKFLPIRDLLSLDYGKKVESYMEQMKDMTLEQIINNNVSDSSKLVAKRT